MPASGAPIPVGADAYAQWERWPEQRVGVRAYLRSTYDRSGGNLTADAGGFLYRLANPGSKDLNVTLDVEGSPGMLYFFRANHANGSPWHITADARDLVVQEAGTRGRHPAGPGVLELFGGLPPRPLVLSHAESRGSDLSWAPIAFGSSLRIAYEHTHYGTGNYIYHQFIRDGSYTRDVNVPAPWSAPELNRAARLLASSGADIAPPVDPSHGVHELSGRIDEARGGQELELFRLAPGVPARIRKLEISVPRGEADRDTIAFSTARIRMRWDRFRFDSVDAPAALFFGAGTLYNRDRTEYLVKAFPVSIRYDAARVHLTCYFPMPFEHAAELRIVAPAGLRDLAWRVRWQEMPQGMNRQGYFHASYRDFPHPLRDPGPGRDLVLLDTPQIEGGGDWHGHIVGTSLVFSHAGRLDTLEGDPRFFFDDSLTPQVQGTGTEEWGGGGDYWEGGRRTTWPLLGHPTGAATGAGEAPLGAQDAIQSAYRFLLADLMPFGKNARVQLEHGGENDSDEHYETVTYWYGAPGALLVRTDRLQIGAPESERQHGYVSRSASAPYRLTSAYEWGPESPASTDLGRYTDGVSEFDLDLIPENEGALLRRKLDYAFANQRAHVAVADVSGGAGDPVFESAGIWKTAGANTYIFSNPDSPDADGAPLRAADNVKTIEERRFREDEFLLNRHLTQGRSKIRVRIEYRSAELPLFSGFDYPTPPGTGAPSAHQWSEMRYDLFVYRSSVPSRPP